MRIREYIFTKWWNLRRYIYKIHADIYPKSPHFDAQSELKLILFKRKVIKLDTFKTPMSKYPGQLDYNFLFVAFPYIDSYETHYPENWNELMKAAREKWENERR